MILLVVCFAAIGLFEWMDLRKRRVQRKTWAKVLGVLALSFIYAVFTLFFHDIAGPNAVLNQWLGPIQDFLMLKMGRS